MHKARSIPELEAFDQRLQEICAGLIYQPGSVFRLALQYFENWGIGLDPGNAGFIEERSVKSYYEEWERGTKDSNEAIRRATQNAKLPYNNPDLNLELGMMAAEIIYSMRDMKDRFTIADVGAGAGDTTVALLDFLDMADMSGKLLERCHFYLIEPSIDRLVDAKRMLKNHGISSKGKMKLTLVASDHDAHLPIVSQGAFDMIVTNAVCHHMTFPTYLRQMHDALASEGVLVMGDWYTTIWSHPAMVLELARELGLGRDEAERFEYMFQIKRGDIRDIEARLEPYQRESNRKMVDYEVQIAREFSKIPPESRLFFLEGHESLEDRLIKISEAGFETDLDELKKRHEGFAKTTRSILNLFPKSDFASVVACARLGGHRPRVGCELMRERVKNALLMPS